MNYQDSDVRFEVRIQGVHVHVSFYGKSTMPGTEAFITRIEEAVVRQGVGVLRVMMDLRGLNSIPLRVQLRMSKWMLAIKSQIDVVVVLGGGQAAKTLAKAARMTNVYFWNDEARALECWQASRP